MPSIDLLKAYPSDSIAYTAADSGCYAASMTLGYPSQCLGNCPFDTCFWEMSRAQQQKIICRWHNTRPGRPQRTPLLAAQH